MVYEMDDAIAAPDVPYLGIRRKLSRRLTAMAITDTHESRPGWFNLYISAFRN